MKFQRSSSPALFLFTLLSLSFSITLPTAKANIRPLCEIFPGKIPCSPPPPNRSPPPPPPSPPPPPPPPSPPPPSPSPPPLSPPPPPSPTSPPQPSPPPVVIINGILRILTQTGMVQTLPNTTVRLACVAGPITEYTTSSTGVLFITLTGASASVFNTNSCVLALRDQPILVPLIPAGNQGSTTVVTIGIPSA